MAKKATQRHLNGKLTRNWFMLLCASVIFLFVNGVYLAAVSFIELLLNQTIENISYQYVFAQHLLVGLLFALLLLIYLIGHLRSIKGVNNRSARLAGKRLAWLALGIALSGILLTRGIALIEITNSNLRQLVYFLHVLLPLVGLWFYRLHRNAANNRVYARKPLWWMVLASVLLTLPATLLTYSDNDPELLVNTNDYSFFPSLIKVEGNEPVNDETLMRDEYCRDCHADTHEHWQASAHHFSSFNNDFYRFAVNNTRELLRERDNNIEASRFCAGCHDPVPLLTGRFDELDFDVNSHPSASAGITCSVCHSVVSIDSPRGNADFTIKPPEHYPFAFSEIKALSWVSQLLIKSNPDFHKRTFLKPLHQSPEFCGSCHKVHIPEELNQYRWLRGQNHYDSFLLSGVSGHNVDSFYYPDAARENCNGCHMQPIPSTDFGSKTRALNEPASILDHLFASGNTALPFIYDNKDSEWISNHEAFLKDALSLDIIGLRKQGEVDGDFLGPINGAASNLQSGEPYLIELVIRNLSLGHSFSNGTTDSNQIWLEVEVYYKDSLIASSGSLDSNKNLDDKNTHLIKNYLVDRQGRPINQRNVEDIHTSVYDHQIPPGAADVIHYSLTLPDPLDAPIEIRAKLNYRKFTSEYLQNSLPEFSATNTLPVTTIATDRVLLNSDESSPTFAANKPPAWQRLNDYGIGLLRKPGRNQFRQAEEVFSDIEAMGHPQGTMNLIRLYYQEGSLDKAAAALQRLDYENISNPWSAEWYSAQINIDNGFYDEAISSLRQLSNTAWPSAKARSFDFSYDYRLINKLAESLVTRSKLESVQSEEWTQLLLEARGLYERVLSLDPENVSGHYGMYQLMTLLNMPEEALFHSTEHQKYLPDENAQADAATLAKSLNPDLDRIANAVVIYDLDVVN